MFNRVNVSFRFADLSRSKWFLNQDDFSLDLCCESQPLFLKLRFHNYNQLFSTLVSLIVFPTLCLRWARD